MGSKRRSISDRITEGREIGNEAVEAGEELEADGSEIKSLLDSIEVADEDDTRAISDAQSGYDSDFKSAFKENVETKEEEMENIESDATNEATEAKEQNEDAESKLHEMAGVTDVGRGNAEGAADSIREGINEYEEQINEAEDTISDTQGKVDSLRSSVDGIFG